MWEGSRAFQEEKTACVGALRRERPLGLVCKGCYNKILQTGWLNQQKFIFTHSGGWKFKIKVAARVVFSTFLLCPHMALFLCTYAPDASSYMDTSAIRLGHLIWFFFLFLVLEIESSDGLPLNHIPTLFVSLFWDGVLLSCLGLTKLLRLTLNLWSSSLSFNINPFLKTFSSYTVTLTVWTSIWNFTGWGIYITQSIIDSEH